MTDALTHVLFGHTDRKLLNLKFLKGESTCSEQDFRDTAADLIQGVETGVIPALALFGDKDIKRLDVKSLVEKL